MWPTLNNPTELFHRAVPTVGDSLPVPDNISLAPNMCALISPLFLPIPRLKKLGHRRTEYVNFYFTSRPSLSRARDTTSHITPLSSLVQRLHNQVGNVKSTSKEFNCSYLPTVPAIEISRRRRHGKSGKFQTRAFCEQVSGVV